MSEIQVNDICHSMYGSKEFRVTSVNSRKVYGEYLHNGNSAVFDKLNVVLSTKRNTTNSNSPFAIDMRVRHTTFDGDVIEGSVIGIKKSGEEIVIEKDNGVILVYNKDDIEEIVPYTVTLLDIASNKRQDFIFTKDTVDIGEMVVYMGGDKVAPYVAQVMAINTKNKGAKKTFTGKKIELKSL